MSGKRSKRIRQLVFIAVHAREDGASEAAFAELQAMDPSPSEVARADKLREDRVERKLINAGIPLPKVLPCPNCGVLHVDKDGWEVVEKAHSTHLCLNPKCGYEWRPFPYATRGILPENAIPLSQPQGAQPIIPSKSTTVLR